jgi:hypothetical protein
MGCPFKGPKVELSTHLKMCPYDLLKDYIARTEQQLVALKHQIEVRLSPSLLPKFFSTKFRLITTKGKQSTLNIG